MDSIVNYFQHIPSLHRALILAGGITFFWLIETAIPLFSFQYNKWKHAGINIFFTITTIVVNFAFALLIVLTSDWCLNHHVGVLQWISMPVWLQLITGLLLLDLIGAWLIHFIQHKVKWMWRFHIIHHSDTHVDTTTANRHHPGESVFRAVFTTLAVFICGAPMWLVFLYQTVSVVLAQFNHANIKMNKRLDKLLTYIVVTPGMHRVHHHYMRPETDTNYGNLFPFWDKLFGTYSKMPVEQVRYGIDILEGHNDEDIQDLLKIPFDNAVKTGIRNELMQPNV
jgi:sterol desaturase/sphingolipid hydroxylase (fatty acid hydroxylase superfamily)